MITVESDDGRAIVHDRSGRGEPLILTGGSFSERSHPTMTRPAEELTEKLTGLSARNRGDAGEFFMANGMGAPAESVAGMRHAPFWSGLEALANTLPYDTAIMGDFSLPTEELASVKAPAFIVRGADAEQWPHRSPGADAVPDAACHALPGQGVAIEPAAHAPELKNFFAN